ncbi:MAG: hypothetical protein WC356_04730 [Candidatus Micrarchaeia archaeon]|jgi:hypothetical protein
MFGSIESIERDVVREKLEIRRIERALAKKAPAVKIEDNYLIVNPNNPNFLEEYDLTQKGLRTANLLVETAKKRIDETTKKNEDLLIKITTDILKRTDRVIKDESKKTHFTIIIPSEESLFNYNPTDTEALALFFSGIEKIEQLSTNLKIESPMLSYGELDFSIIAVTNKPNTVRISSAFTEHLEINIIEELNEIREIINKMEESYNYLTSNFFKKLLKPKYWFHGFEIGYINVVISDYQIATQKTKGKIYEEIKEEKEKILIENNIPYAPLSNQIKKLIVKQIDEYIEQTNRRFKEVLAKEKEDIKKGFNIASEKLKSAKESAKQELVYFLSEYLKRKGTQEINMVLLGELNTTLEIHISTKKEPTDEELKKANEEADFFGSNQEPSLTFELAKEE